MSEYVVCIAAPTCCGLICCSIVSLPLSQSLKKARKLWKKHDRKMSTATPSPKSMIAWYNKKKAPDDNFELWFCLSPLYTTDDASPLLSDNTRHNQERYRACIQLIVAHKYMLISLRISLISKYHYVLMEWSMRLHSQTSLRVLSFVVIRGACLLSRFWRFVLYCFTRSSSLSQGFRTKSLSIISFLKASVSTAFIFLNTPCKDKFEDLGP